MREILGALHRLPLAVENPVLVFAIVMVIMLVAPLLFTRIRLPGIVGLIVAGVVVGPHGLGMFTRDGIFELLGTVGLLYLMFLAGLEINLNQFWRQRNHSLVFGSLTFFIPQVLGAVLAVPLFGMSWPTAILLASMFASHTLIPYPIVTRLGIAKHRAVTTTIGGTILTDTAALLVLSVIAEATRSESGINAAFWVRQTVSIAVLVGATLWGLPRLGYWFFRNTNPDGPGEFIFVMAAVFLSAFGAELAGIEPIIGAFLAGLALSPLIMEQSPLMRRLEFTGNALFIPFFLLSVGMLVDLRVLGGGLAAWGIAGYMTAMVMAAKWLAAECSRRALGYSRDEGRVIFGLSVNQAAATLAAVLVGYRIGLFDDSVLNGTIMMILVTCIVGPLVTERYGRRLALDEKSTQTAVTVSEGERILVPLSNMRNVEALMDLALMLRHQESRDPLYPLSVALEGPDVERNVTEGERILGNAVVRVTAAEAPVQPVTRIDTNIVGGILHALRELRITTVVMGWSGEAPARHLIFHSIQDRLLERSRQMVVIARLNDPLNTTKRVVLLAPPLIERQPGLREALRTLKHLTGRVGARLLVVGLEDSLALLRPAIEGLRPHLPVEFQAVAAWHALVREVGPQLTTGDLVALLCVRRGQLAWQPSLERFPAMFTREFPQLGLLAVFPPDREDEDTQDDDEPAAAPEMDAAQLLPELANDRVRCDLDGLDMAAAVRALLGTSFAMQPAVLDELVGHLLEVEPVELAPGAILLHAHVMTVTDSIVFLGINHAAFAHPALSRPAQVLFVLLSARQQSPERHLKALARIARFVHDPATVARLAQASNLTELATMQTTAS